MADLYAIYQKEGLSGLVPYALKETSHGYRILIDKIKAGNPLCFIRTQMDTPYIIVKDGLYQSMFYTTREAAEEQVKELRVAGYQPEVEDLPDGPARKEALLWLFDHGPSAILLDNSLSIPIQTLASDVPAYDGRPNEEHMLRNRILNGATFYFLQQAAAGYGNMEAERAWAKAIYNSELIAAVENNVAKNYPSLSVKVGEKNALLIYSDWRQMGFDFDDLPAGIIVNFDSLYQVLRENKNVSLLLNRPTCHLVIDLPMLDVIRDIATGTGSAAPIALGFAKDAKKKRLPYVQVSDEEWDLIDPTPDFLR